MSVSSTSVKAGPFNADGVQKVFNFAFKAFKKTDIRVVLTNAAGVETDLIVDVNYTVNLAINQNVAPGGYITTVATYAAGQKITLVSNQEPTQLVNFTNFRPDVIERALDKLTLLYQQTVEQLSRAVKVDISSGLSPSSILAAISQAVGAAAASATNAQASADSASDFSDVADAAADRAETAAGSANLSAQEAADFVGTVKDIPYAITSGTSSAYLVDFTAYTPEIAEGKLFVVQFHTACAAFATLQINGLMPVLDIKVKRSDGTFVPVAAGDITGGSYSVIQVIQGGTAVLVEPSTLRANVAYIAASTTLTPENALDMTLIVTANVSVTLPLLASFQEGAGFTLAFNTLATVVPQGAEVIRFYGTDLTAMSPHPTDTWDFVKSNGKWLVVIMSLDRAVGLGQVYQTFTTVQRAPGSTYTNSLRKAVTLIISGSTSGASGNCTVNVNGSAVTVVPWAGLTSNAPFSITVLIPQGATYSYTTTGVNLSISELR